MRKHMILAMAMALFLVGCGAGDDSSSDGTASHDDISVSMRDDTYPDDDTAPVDDVEPDDGRYLDDGTPISPADGGSMSWSEYLDAMTEYERGRAG